MWVSGFSPVLEPIDIENGGVFLVHKPIAYTSFKIVKSIEIALRKRFDLKKIKVGHAGTLDPLATGLLIVCYGKFTKKIDTYQGQVKQYRGTFLLGQTTPSHDLETAPDAHFPTEHLNADLLHGTTKLFLGKISQVPPVYSAIKKDGKTLYKQVREGKEVETPEARQVEINNFDLTEIRLPTEVDFWVQCSKGTYIRSLAYDFGKKLGSGGTLAELCRTAIGEHKLEQAWELHQLLAHIEAS